MGRAVVTKGHRGRRLGRTIRKMEASVEFSAKECQEKKAETKYKEKVQPFECEDSPVENLRDAFNRRKGDALP